MPAFIDITGYRFGRWLVIGKHSRRHNHWYWLCQCDCGKQGVVPAQNLKRGVSKSCGCWAKELLITHGHRVDYQDTPTLSSWRHMITRCYNPNDARRWRDYGGRGIKVCDRWRHSFLNFLADMGERPPEKTLDRIDNDGNYEPSNCQWATPSEQIKNRRKLKKRVYRPAKQLALPLQRNKFRGLLYAQNRRWKLRDKPARLPPKRKPKAPNAQLELELLPSG